MGTLPTEDQNDNSILAYYCGTMSFISELMRYSLLCGHVTHM